MPAVTRSPVDTTVGICDLGLPCCPHSRNGNNSTHSPDVICNGIPVHRLTDTGPTNCPHGGTYKSVQGSSNVYVNSLPITRIGDKTVCVVCGCSGTHNTGSDNTFAGG